MAKTSITKRKKDHLKFALSDTAQVGNTGFDNYRFVHNAAPEVDFEKIDTTTTFLGKKVNYPFFISCMTAGVERGQDINRNLAKAAQKFNIAMGVGSQRIAIEHSEYVKLFKVRKYAPAIPLIANVGLVQLNYGFGLAEFQKIVDMIEADVLAVHLNPIQEVIQPEGDRNFENLLPKLEKIIKKLSVPIIIKEVGFGLSYEVVKRFYDIGVNIFDTAGWGGTNWAVVEGLRGKADKQLGELFSNWGIPTTESIRMCNEFKSKLSTSHRSQVTVLGSGGIRTGIDIAKAIRLGSDLVGLAAPFAQAALKSSGEVEKLIERLALETRVAMFGVGAKNVPELKRFTLQRVR